MRSPRCVDGFSLKDHHLNLTLTHSNLGSKIETHFISNPRENERDEINIDNSILRSRGEREREINVTWALGLVWLTQKELTSLGSK